MSVVHNQNSMQSKDSTDKPQSSSQHSLPSFAQTFHSIASRSDAGHPLLPPIHALSSRTPNSNSAAPSSTRNVDSMARDQPRKRSHDHLSNYDSDSHVKQDPEGDLPMSPIRRSHQPAPTTPTADPPKKKRRVTVSTESMPDLRVNTDVPSPIRQSHEPRSATAISPLVVGFSVPRNDATSMEQVRTTLDIKVKQKAIIEQRRGSVSGNGQEPNAHPTRESDGNPSFARTSGTTSKGHVHSPPPVGSAPPSSQNAQGSGTDSNFTLPPTPGFARRRSMLSSRKAAPSELMIRPPPQSQAQTTALAPLIQSAPPVPASRFRLSVGSVAESDRGVPSIRRSAQVPPAPASARLSKPNSIPRPISGQVPMTATGSTFRTNVHPPTPSSSNTFQAPLAHSQVPPTPSSLRHALNPPQPSASSSSARVAPKAAFLSVFENFYDQLADSRQLKGWLQDQVQRSNTLLQSLQGAEGRIASLVSEEVENRLKPMREEVDWLRSRVEELSDALQAASGDKGKGKGPTVNGDQVSRPAAPIRGPSSPRLSDRDNTPSPTPHDPRRMTTSSTRLDPPPRMREDMSGGSSFAPRARPRVPSPLVANAPLSGNSKERTANGSNSANSDSPISPSGPRMDTS
ncbi:hypothetical protein SISSUDRAFT_1058438 [Sistotremastrum suecicum HHB10207 ss-3]|uniref:Uncharacterized protein n=1 Tax=Sistotremastrum suecicum HHB10207 ss-3 TaxID=1314776 RepID=A0A166HFT0_9AGAM|nr:hypothetical protein SISSUDRAFT_1058438 [Sistotremastrum suecicum HHB10207 ss-3]